MNKGDTIKFLLNLTYDGEPVTQGLLDEIEFTISGLTFTTKNGTITWNIGEQCYELQLSQAQTKTLQWINPYQVRVLKDGEVVSTEVELFRVGEVLSNNILTGV